jgi:hypothetical protein
LCVSADGAIKDHTVVSDIDEVGSPRPGIGRARSAASKALRRNIDFEARGYHIDNRDVGDRRVDRAQRQFDVDLGFDRGRCHRLALLVVELAKNFDPIFDFREGRRQIEARLRQLIEQREVRVAFDVDALRISRHFGARKLLILNV